MLRKQFLPSFLLLILLLTTFSIFFIKFLQSLKVDQEVPSIKGVYDTKKSPYHSSNVPTEGSILSEPPINVVVSFNLHLSSKSEIKVLRDGKDFSYGKTHLDQDKLSMWRLMDNQAGDGLYRVEYKACWEIDETCSYGSFLFEIRRTIDGNYKDLTGQAKVIVNMENLRLHPEDIVISRGTYVKWINNDSVPHLVSVGANSTLNFNSHEILPGEEHSFVFTQLGEYSYYCGFNPDSMAGSIVVADY